MIISGGKNNEMIETKNFFEKNIFLSKSWSLPYATATPFQLLRR